MIAQQLADALKDYLSEHFPDIQVQVMERDADHERRRVFFRSEWFSVLYPLQRYHYIIHHIPTEFYDEHLTDTEWYELAPGESEGDLCYPDEELVRSIAPDVMRCLHVSGFFRSLDDRLSPKDASPSPECCHGDFRIARSVLKESGFSEEEHFDVFHVLMEQGAYCDCEVLYNIALESRLREQHWNQRSGPHEKGPVQLEGSSSGPGSLHETNGD